MLKRREVTKFQKEILDWYKKNKRDLPWRDVPYGTSLQDRFYRVLISEIMLQQTQVSRVIPKYEVWFKTFPAIDVLAKASTRDVLRVWSGLWSGLLTTFLWSVKLVIWEKSNHRQPLLQEKLL